MLSSNFIFHLIRISKIPKSIIIHKSINNSQLNSNNTCHISRLLRESVFPLATASINSAIYRILAKVLKMAEYIPVEYLAYVGKTLNLIARQVGSNYNNLAIFLAQWL